MQKEERANGGLNSKGSKPKTFINAGAINNAFDVCNITEKREELQANLLAVMKPTHKVIRLYRCFGCDKNFALRRMSSCLILCRGCHTSAQDKGKTAQRNFTAKTLNAIHGFLRRTLQNA